MNGTDVEEIVPPGTLAKPSGIEIHGGLIYVTDAATSTFNVYDKTGKAVRSLATDLPAGALAGFTFAPDGKIYFTDKIGGRVLRIDPQ
jgi:streptogramin lyase